MDNQSEKEVEGKTRVTLPEYIYNIILQDEGDFGLNNNKLCNLIFELYNEKIDFNETYVKTKYNKTIQFTLSNDNKDIYADLASRHDITNKAEYFRKLIFHYCDQPKYKREIIINEKSVKLINSAIKAGKKLKIKYKDEYRIIEPYFIINSDGETRNYIFCYCEKNGEYRNYRVTNIKAIAVMRENWENYSEEIVETLKNNFDPFLSNGKKVKVKFTKEGIKHYERVITNKPKKVKNEGDVYIFECSELKAKLYFPQFLDEVEIIEPKELRAWFKEKYKKLFEKYQD